MTSSKKSRMMGETGELVQFFREPAAGRTVNPPGNEAAAAAVAARCFDKYHTPYKTYEKTYRRTNIVGTLAYRKDANDNNAAMAGVTIAREFAFAGGLLPG